MDRLTRQEASDAVAELGWRYVLGTFRTHVRVDSLAQAAQVAATVATDDHLRIDLRADEVILTLQTPKTAFVTRPDIQAASRISAGVKELGLATRPDGVRAAQLVEIAIDAMDIPAIRPFWKAVFAYQDETPDDDNGLADPLGQSPSLWFQQMDKPRPQRNRIHFDISVPHDQAQTRIEAALAAGGTLLSDEGAPAFWVLADREGNEACITTWQGRD